MAVYKVPQDVEAEDKFLGPLSFKQFLFFGGTAICGYLTFLMLTKHILFLVPVFALPAIAFGILAFPWSKEQPSELWLAAHIRFLFISRKRIWDQSGVKDLVTITVPKHKSHALTDGLTPDEVKTRFNALASVIDSRGWAVKNLSSSSAKLASSNSDRLVTLDVTASNMEEEIVNQTDDIMDETKNPLAQQFDTMMENSKSKHHSETLDMIEEARQMSEGGAVLSMTLPNPAANQKPTGPSSSNSTKTEDFWFLNQQPQSPPAGFSTFQAQTVVAPGQETHASTLPTTNPVAVDENDEQQLLQKVHAQKQKEAQIKQQSHLKTIQPVTEQTATSPSTANPLLNPSATPVDPAILALSGNNDLNVDTIARQANKGKLENDEVVIELH